MAKPRKTVIYRLKDKRRTAYIGTTDDPDRREEKHRQEGKRFTKLTVMSRRMTEEGAKKQEAEQLGVYRRNHHGRNPRYNKDSDG